MTVTKKTKNGIYSLLVRDKHNDNLLLNNSSFSVKSIISALSYIRIALRFELHEDEVIQDVRDFLDFKYIGEFDID